MTQTSVRQIVDIKVYGLFAFDFISHYIISSLDNIYIWSCAEK